jgi:histidinol-phosphate/aromatic aminotransferase/cobyric acid decarboxylase-like protein
MMAKVAGISLTSVQRIWKTHGLAPHRIKTFKLSNDPKFAAKVRDIVGLYVDPPAHAVVLIPNPENPDSMFFDRSPIPKSLGF